VKTYHEAKESYIEYRSWDSTEIGKYISTLKERDRMAIRVMAMPNTVDRTGMKHSPQGKRLFNCYSSSLEDGIKYVEQYIRNGIVNKGSTGGSRRWSPPTRVATDEESGRPGAVVEDKISVVDMGADKTTG
jgi:hypothetical protein